jgi:hypothetical protein
MAEEIKGSDPEACSIGDCLQGSMRLSAIAALGDVLKGAGFELPKLSPLLEDLWVSQGSHEDLAVA